MANQLVKFPKAGESWEEVDGPGMYVLTMLPRQDETDECAVGAAITVLRPGDGPIMPGSQFWSTKESLEGDEKLFEQAGELFDEKGEHGKAALVRAQLPLAALSQEMVAAVHLGSTGRTLKSRETGEYWQARWEDLSPSGVLLLHQLHTCFIRSPLILTFLGDKDSGK